jgi:hypothetical protein
MRILAFAAIALLAGAGQHAVAWSPFETAGSCTKGMLWPYVRNPGDCLTEAEIQAGQRGVYSGPTETNPDVGAMAPPPLVQQVPAAPVAPAAPVVAPVLAAPVAGVAAPAVPASATPVAANPNIRTVTTFSCNKSTLWPFIRKPGDCLTTPEKKKGLTGVYGGGSGLVVTQVSAATGQPVVYQQAAPGTVVADSGGQVVLQQPAQPVQPAAAAAPSCTKGALWPFVKKPGDCQTTTEQRRSK